MAKVYIKNDTNKIALFQLYGSNTYITLEPGKRFHLGKISTRVLNYYKGHVSRLGLVVVADTVRKIAEPVKVVENSVISSPEEVKVSEIVKEEETKVELEKYNIEVV